MQTFLPYDSIQRSVHCLDSRRLGKQRVEAKQLHTLLTNGTMVGWAYHPAAKMWRGFENCLAHYHNECILQWMARGHKNNMPLLNVGSIIYPPWFGGAIHVSHRDALLYKATVRLIHEGNAADILWYQQFGWENHVDVEEAICGGKFEHYHWPV